MLYNGCSYCPPPGCLNSQSKLLVCFKQVCPRIHELLYLLSNQSTVSPSVSRPTVPRENPESFLLEHTFSFLFLLLTVLSLSPMLG